MADPGSSNDYEESAIPASDNQGMVGDDYGWSPGAPPANPNYFQPGGGSMGGYGDEAQRAYGASAGGTGFRMPENQPGAAPAGGAWWNVPSPPNREQGGIYAGTPVDKGREISPTGGGTRTGGRAGGAAGGVISNTPFIPAPYAPTVAPYVAGEFKPTGEFALPEYAPPEENKRLEMQKREEFSASGRQALGKKSTEALLTTRNLDNPNARAKMLESVLSGYGQGYEKVAGEAGNAANRYAQQKRSEELHTYASKWSADAEVSRKRYETDFGNQLRNFMMGEAARQQNYTQQQHIYDTNYQATNQANLMNWKAGLPTQAIPGAAGSATRMKPFTGSGGASPNYFY